jgi:hypothetical protein
MSPDTLLGASSKSASAGAVNAPLGNALEVGAMIAAARASLCSSAGQCLSAAAVVGGVLLGQGLGRGRRP